MPPAFNLSQDQTLQFNLCLKTHSLNGIDQIFTSEFLLFTIREYSVRRPGLFRPRLSRPNTHAYRLLIFKERFRFIDLPAVLFAVVISEERNYGMVLSALASRAQKS